MTSEKLYEIGQCQLDERNYETAYDYFLEAAHMGHARAIKSLGILYLYGDGVSQNYEKAFKYLQKAFELSGRMWASYEVADCLLDIRGCEEGRIVYREYLDNLVAQDTRDAYIYKGEELLKGIVYPQNIDEAIKLYEKAIKRGDGFGAELLGQMYFDGKYIKQDYEKAFEYFQLCDVPRSYVKNYYMGVMYMKGIYVEKDITSAIEYFRSIVDDDDPWKTEDGYYNMAKDRLAEIITGEVKGNG